MSSFKILGGTPVVAEPLCNSCKNALLIRGFSVAEVVYLCDVLYPTRSVPFLVRECSMYADKRRDDIEAMEKIAWLITTPSINRKVGFVPSVTSAVSSTEAPAGAPVNNDATRTTE